MEKSERFGFLLSTKEKNLLTKLAKLEGGLSQAALIRRLIRKAAENVGIIQQANDSYDFRKIIN